MYVGGKVTLVKNDRFFQDETRAKVEYVTYTLKGVEEFAAWDDQRSCGS